MIVKQECLAGMVGAGRVRTALSMHAALARYPWHHRGYLPQYTLTHQAHQRTAAAAVPQ